MLLKSELILLPMENLQFNNFSQKQILQWQVSNAHGEEFRLSDSVWHTIDSISHLCPAAYGMGVYEARDLYLQYSPGTIYNDNIACNMGNGSFKTIDHNILADQALLAGSVSVYPNPAKDVISINYVCDNNKEARFQLFDMFGKIVKELTLVPTEVVMDIDIQSLASGIYNYKVVFNRCSNVIGKLNIIK
jgi:hypothetical protein